MRCTRCDREAPPLVRYRGDLYCAHCGHAWHGAVGADVEDLIPVGVATAEQRELTARIPLGDKVVDL